MINIRFDKKLDLIFGLLYSVSKDYSCNYNWITSTDPNFDEAFYQMYKKGINKEFEEYIIKGGLDSYNRTVEIAFSLNDNYEIILNSEIEKIINQNKNFNPNLLSSYLKEFVNKMDYENFYHSFLNIQKKFIANFLVSINAYGEFHSDIIENFFGYSKGYMEIVLLNFSSGSYGITLDDHIVYVSCLTKNGQFSKHILSTLFHEFSHPYVNPLGEAYFKNKSLEWLLMNSKENGLENCYTTVVTLINEYLVRAIQMILSSNFFEKEYILNQINCFKKIGYPYMEELIQVFELKNNYPYFETFYEKEIVKFFIELNERIEHEKKKIRKHISY